MISRYPYRRRRIVRRVPQRAMQRRAPQPDRDLPRAQQPQTLARNTTGRSSSQGNSYEQRRRTPSLRNSISASVPKPLDFSQRVLSPPPPVTAPVQPRDLPRVTGTPPLPNTAYGRLSRQGVSYDPVYAPGDPTYASPDGILHFGATTGAPGGFAMSEGDYAALGSGAERDAFRRDILQNILNPFRQDGDRIEHGDYYEGKNRVPGGLYMDRNPNSDYAEAVRMGDLPAPGPWAYPWQTPPPDETEHFDATGLTMRDAIAPVPQSYGPARGLGGVIRDAQSQPPLTGGFGGGLGGRARDVTGGSPSLGTAPPARGGGQSPGGGNQGGGNQGGGQPTLPLDPAFEAGRRALDDQLSATLAGLGASRQEIQATLALVMARLEQDRAEALSQTNEAANARGIYNSGIRFEDLGDVYSDFQRQQQDLAADAGRQARELAMAESGARADYGRGISELLADLAARSAANGLGGATEAPSQNQGSGQRRRPRNRRRNRSRNRRRGNR